MTPCIRHLVARISLASLKAVPAQRVPTQFQIWNFFTFLCLWQLQITITIHKMEQPAYATSPLLAIFRSCYKIIWFLMEINYDISVKVAGLQMRYTPQTTNYYKKKTPICQGRGGGAYAKWSCCVYYIYTIKSLQMKKHQFFRFSLKYQTKCCDS